MCHDCSLLLYISKREEKPAKKYIQNARKPTLGAAVISYEGENFITSRKKYSLE